MKEFKGEMFSTECAEKHLCTLKAKLTDKKHADNLADQNLENAEMALIEAQQAVQAAKEHKNKTQIDAKGADDDVLDFSKAMEITPFTETEKTLMKMQKEIGIFRGAGNLSRCNMKNVRVMTDDEVLNVLKMLDLGATHVNFQISNDGVNSSYGDWSIDLMIDRYNGDYDELEFSITNSKLMDDEDDYDEGNIFDHDYTCDMFFINEQNEIIDGAYMNFKVDLDRFDKNRMDNSDLKYKICINIFPYKQSDC